MTNPSQKAHVAINLAPKLLRDPVARRLFRRVARQLVQTSADSQEGIQDVRRDVATRAQQVSPYWRPAFCLCASVLCDLRGHRWTFSVDQHSVLAYPPGSLSGSALERKEQLRASHLVDRDAQLATPATHAFIYAMEARRLHNGEWHSIYSLMRDGPELAASLGSLNDPTESQLRSVIDPYVQVVDQSSECEFTGLRLADIWRYFRHTWTITYNSTPGRRLQFLVRDRAAPNHAVIGIGALGSAVVQLGPRDEWIGWTAGAFLSHLDEDPSLEWARWVNSNLDKLLAGLYVKDLIRDGVIRRADIAHPSTVVIEALRSDAEHQRRVHRLYPSRATHKSLSNDAHKWLLLAETSLFRAKRAETLAKLLEARAQLLVAGFQHPTAANLKRALTNPAARRAIQTILRQVKSTHVGINMMDITVCGAVAPYNVLLGGKLVALLMASPAVTSTYSKHYQRTPSIIASAMAARPIVRPPRLVILGTTSLYDVAPSQYNRIKVSSNLFGGSEADVLQYTEVGATDGVGSFQFSQETMRAIDIVLARGQKGRLVNSIFGEGVNPKLRKIRGALDAVGLPTTEFLTHGNSRIIYGIPLASNFRDILLGKRARPKYILPQIPLTTDRLVSYWLTRWLRGRITRDTVLTNVACHRKSYPMAHGARVQLPADPEALGPLFSGGD